MKFRCPYCKHVMEEVPGNQCPSCNRTMMLPDKILHPGKQDKKKIKEAIAREADLKRKALGIGDISLGGKPSGIIFAVAILAFAGILLLSKARPPEQSGLRTREMIAEQDLGVLSIALERFKQDCGRYPATEEGLLALIANPGIPNWPKSYVNLIRPDPWRQHYIYQSTNNTYILFSSGPDKIPETADDVTPPIATDPALTNSPVSATAPGTQEVDPSDKPQQ